MDKKALIDKIKEIRETFKENEWCYRVSEENVRAEIIDPILRILGWKLPYIKREEHSMDYVLCSEKDIHVDSKIVVVEAKKFKEQLWYDGVSYDSKTGENVAPCPEQLGQYLTNSSHFGKIQENYKLGVLTNGIRWYLCDSKKRIKNEIVLVEIDEYGEIKNIDSDYGVFCDFFELISFDQLDAGFHKLMDNKGVPEPLYEKFEQPKIICIKDRDNKIDEYKGRNGEYSHCNALYFVAKKADDMISMKQKDERGNLDFSLINYFFHKDIVSSESTKRTEEECPERGCFYVGDYLFYEKVALLQEINTSFDLGLTIYLK